MTNVIVVRNTLHFPQSINEFYYENLKIKNQKRKSKREQKWLSSNFRYAHYEFFHKIANRFYILYMKRIFFVGFFVQYETEIHIQIFIVNQGSLGKKHKFESSISPLLKFIFGTSS